MLSSAPTADAGGPYTVFAGFTVGVHATGGDADGDPLTYAWDLDDNGSFETPGQSATYSAATANAPGSHTIAVQATDSGGLTGDDTAIVNVVVTYDSLCALTRERVSKKNVADDLCKKLAQAKKALDKPGPLPPHGHGHGPRPMPPPPNDHARKEHDKKLEEYRKKLEPRPASRSALGTRHS